MSDIIYLINKEKCLSSHILASCRLVVVVVVAVAVGASKKITDHGQLSGDGKTTRDSNLGTFEPGTLQEALPIQASMVASMLMPANPNP